MLHSQNSLNAQVNGAERRRFERTRVRLPVELEVSGLILEDCMISNLSENGAEISVPGFKNLPDRFRILCPNNTFKMNVEKRWSAPGKVGVQFV